LHADARMSTADARANDLRMSASAQEVGAPVACGDAHTVRSGPRGRSRAL